MALPKNESPIFELYLPLSKTKVLFRPFLVKEEKILMMAVEANDQNSSILAIKQILTNCCLSDHNIEELPVTDLEYFFLNLRSRSIGENVELQYKCNNMIGETPCGNVMKMDINLLDIEPEISPEHSNKIELNDKLGIVMKYPTFKMMENNDSDDEIERIIGVIIDSIDYIYDDENIYYSKDTDRKELVEFIDSMTKDQFEKVQDFFSTLPKLKKDIEFKCSKCGYEEHILVEGLQNFFS